MTFPHGSGQELLLVLLKPETKATETLGFCCLPRPDSPDTPRHRKTSQPGCLWNTYPETMTLCFECFLVHCFKQVPSVVNKCFSEVLSVHTTVWEMSSVSQCPKFSPSFVKTTFLFFLSSFQFPILCCPLMGGAAPEHCLKNILNVSVD